MGADIYEGDIDRVRRRAAPSSGVGRHLSTKPTTRQRAGSGA